MRQPWLAKYYFRKVLWPSAIDVGKEGGVEPAGLGEDDGATESLDPQKEQPILLTIKERDAVVVGPGEGEDRIPRHG